MSHLVALTSAVLHVTPPLFPQLYTLTIVLMKASNAQRNSEHLKI